MSSSKTIKNKQNSEKIQEMERRFRIYAAFAAIGAVGDEFFVDGCLVSENRDVTLEAVKQGKMEIKKQPVGERYYLNTPTGQVEIAGDGIKGAGFSRPVRSDDTDDAGGRGFERNTVQDADDSNAQLGSRGAGRRA